MEDIQHQYESTWYHKTLSAYVQLYILYSQSKLTTHTNKNTAPLIITRLRSHINNLIHNNPNYIMNI